MRHLFVVLFSFFLIQAHAQSFINYKDTINQFSINIPVGWKYGINKSYPDIILIASRTPTSNTDTVRDNFNINTIYTPKKDLDQTFADFLSYLPDAKDYKLIDTGTMISNSIKFKWLIETHKNEGNNVQMLNYDFVALKSGKTYILTMVTFSYAFETIKPTFDKIASSFKLLN
jgi:hypothetical protein